MASARPASCLAVAALAAALLAAGGALAGGQLYEWVDKDGVVHLDDLPPEQAYRTRGGAPPAGGVKVATPGRGRSPQRGPALGSSGRAGSGRKPSRRLDWWERSNDAPPDEIDRAANFYNIPSELIRAVIAVESDGNAAAVSRKGAVGLMQLMPETAGRMFVRDPVDPVQNIQGGTRYLRTLANQFGGDMMLVLAAYTAGPENVRKYGGVPPFAETQGYVRKVIQKFNEYKLHTSRQRGDQLARNAGRAEGGVSRP
jgi:hypothetical protein